MDRRNFLKKCISVAAAAGVTALSSPVRLLGQEKSDEKISDADIVAVRNGEPETMFDRGIKSMGGMKKFVKKGNTVVVKPNIAWNSSPEGGADTNPALVERIIEHCYNAGAKKVYVFDHTCHNWESTYKVSGIEEAAKRAGATVVPAHRESYYEDIKIPGARTLKEAKIHELIMESDVFINVPILKHHGSTLMTGAMKNLMGVVWDRGFYHRTDLQRCIMEFCLFRKPDLNVIDAYRVMMKGGPMCYDSENVVLKKMQLLSTDILAVDAASARILGREPEDIGYIRHGREKNLGNANLDALNIKKLVI